MKTGAKAIMEAPLDTFVAVKDDIKAEMKRREEFDLASYVVLEHVKKLI